MSTWKNGSSKVSQWRTWPPSAWRHPLPARGSRPRSSRSPARPPGRPNRILPLCRGIEVLEANLAVGDELALVLGADLDAPELERAALVDGLTNHPQPAR